MDKQEQFDEFITNNLQNALRLANIYVKNTYDAEDIVSESIEKAMRKMHALKDPDALKLWFFKIVINTSINYIKKKKKTIPLADIPEINLYYFEDYSKIEFEEILVMMPKEDRQIFTLRFCDNHELGEIAKMLGMNENTVKTRFYRALKKMKLEINENGDRLKVRRNNNVAKNITIGISVILVSAVCVFNLSPALAKAAYDIPVIDNIIRLITFNRFEYKDNGYDAKILVPEIKGLLDPEVLDKINIEFRENAEELIRSFEEIILEAEELGDDTVLMSIKADYTVKTDNESVLSIDAYIYSDINGFVIHKFCTIDKQAGTLITLPDLFKPDGGYIASISEYILREMKRINEEEGGAFVIGDSSFAVFNEIRPDNNFYINEDGKLVICFDKYEVAAGFMGSPEFVIPSEVIAQNILNSDLIKRLLNNNMY